MCVRELFEYAKSCLTTKLLDFKGRAPRQEVWGFVLFSGAALILSIAIMTLTSKILSVHEHAPSVLGFVWIGGLAMLAIWFVTAWFFLITRRYHDLGFNGWWYLGSIILLMLIHSQILYILFFVAMIAAPGHEAKNAYGPNPLQPVEVKAKKIVKKRKKS